MVTSFRTSLLLIFISLLGLTLAVTLWAVLRAIDANARANAERELAVAERVFETLLDENSRQLTDRTTLLAEDFAFRQAIATNEENTIISVLANHGERIGADLILMLDPEGEVRISTHAISEDVENLRDYIRSGREPFTELTITEGQPYQLVMVPVEAPDLIAWVGMGFVMDSELMNVFRDITKAEVTVLYRDDGSGAIRTLSTLNDNPLAIPALSGEFSSALNVAANRLRSEGWLSRQNTLVNTDDQQLGILMSVSLQEALAAYNKLQTQLLGIAFVALLLAAVVTVLIARGITRPIDTLVRAARRIASGDYHQPVELDRQNEFGVLSDTLNSMQGAIQDREQHIAYQAQHDLLTGLPNRDRMATVTTERLTTVDREPFGALLLQLANFDALSDVYGVSVMDRVLQQVADRLDRNGRQEDSISRVGTDEFLILAERLSQAQCRAVVHQYLLAFEAPIHCDAIEIKVEARLGVVLCPEHADTYEDILRRAHIALTDARLHGLKFALYETGRDEVHRRKITVTHRLQQAILNGGFELMFQPQFSLREGRIHSAEALIRWEDPELGRMFPDEFIPLAEQSGDITLITDWVLGEALRQMEAWQAAGHEVGVSINLSAKDILRDDFIDGLVARLQHNDIRRDALMLEITESAVMTDPDHALRNLQRLYDAGAKLAMDDFGTGFSSLAQLKSMPVHELKIDKSFVLRLDRDEDDQRIVHSTIEMAHHLGLSVIAEGVENQASMSLLRDMGCDAIQGYYLSKPQSAHDLRHWLTTFDRQRLVTLNS